MTHALQPPESDLWLPRPGPGEIWDPAAIHTHYHGLHIPQERISAYIYVLYRPYFGLCQGGLLVCQGDANYDPLDMAYADYEMTMPWPQIDERSVTTANGLRIEFLELGRKDRLTYTSPDGHTRLDVTQEAVTPLLARGHIIPGEDVHRDPSKKPGGTEQMMHVTGELVLHGKRYAVDCYNPRDRSWGQVRTESMHRRAKIPVLPPVGWTPMYFGADLIFNSAGYVPASSNPNWIGLYDPAPDRRPDYYSWMVVDGEQVSVKRVTRTVHEYHPVLHTAHKQEVEVEIEGGKVFRFFGETTSMCNAVAWPNCAIRCGAARWTDENGRVCDNSYQEQWFDHVYQRAMNKRSGQRTFTG